MEDNASSITLQRTMEPNEGAFNILNPPGWEIEGGIFRVDPMLQARSAQSIAAKSTFAAKRDAPEGVMMRWLPEML